MLLELKRVDNDKNKDMYYLFSNELIQAVVHIDTFWDRDKANRSVYDWLVDHEEATIEINLV